MSNFPEQPRSMTEAEGETYFQNMLSQIRAWQPDTVVAVARSGLAYAQWVAQELTLPIGIYWPGQESLVIPHAHKRIVFVDDNILQGSTFLAAKDFLQRNGYNDDSYRWAVLFSDWHTPKHIREQIIQGVRLPYFAQEPFWGTRKISKDYGVRFRDE